MNDRGRDRDLARLFGELRLAEEAEAPPFRQILERSGGRRAPSVRPALLRLTAASAVLALIVVAMFLGRRPLATTPNPPGGGPSLAEWKAPTDGLLRTPGSELWDTVPRIVFPPDLNRELSR